MKTLISAAFISAVAGAASAADLARWTFESSVPSAAGPFTAEAGVNGASSEALGIHANGSAIYSNPVGNGSFESFSSNFWTAGDSYQFRTSTIGYDSIAFTWAQVSSSTGPTDFALQWSSDGTNFSTLQNYVVATSPSWSSGSPSNGAIFAPVALPAGAANLPNVWVRLTSLVTPGNTAGTSRVDDVAFTGNLVPTPGTSVMLIAAGLVAARRRRG